MVAGVSVEDELRLVERDRQVAELEPAILANGKERWAALRRLYKLTAGDHYHPYLIDWTRIFTPIERHAWGAIRDCGLPFFPQYPIGRYFVDFAEPLHKLVIECDGRRWHDADRDRQRDHELNQRGWTVFRVSGADCNRILKTPGEVREAQMDGDLKTEEAFQKASAWYETTVDGLVAAIAWGYFSAPLQPHSDLADIIARVLRNRSQQGVAHGAY